MCVCVCVCACVCACVRARARVCLFVVRVGGGRVQAFGAFGLGFGANNPKTVSHGLVYLRVTSGATRGRSVDGSKLHNAWVYVQPQA